MDTLLDTSKLEDLYRDLGNNKPFFVDLANTYRSQIDEFLVFAQSDQPPFLADVVHKLAGSTGLVGPQSMVDKILALEVVLRADQPYEDKMMSLVHELPLLLASLDVWIANLPET